jgi:hypothetical protein
MASCVWGRSKRVSAMTYKATLKFVVLTVSRCAGDHDLGRRRAFERQAPRRYRSGGSQCRVAKPAAFPRSRVAFQYEVSRAATRVCFQHRRARRQSETRVEMTETTLLSRPWTQADDDKLRRLALTGLSSRAIGIQMNRTETAVHSRARQMRVILRKIRPRQLQMG